jgi:hypothetical protein
VNEGNTKLGKIGVRFPAPPTNDTDVTVFGQADASMTGLELVREVASKYGCENITDAQADFVLWNHTSYPFVQSGVKDIENWFRDQLEKVFSRPGDLLDKLVADTAEYEIVSPIMES